MKCTPELLEKIKDAVESVPYGSVKINLAEGGGFVEILIERKIRIDKAPLVGIRLPV